MYTYVTTPLIGIVGANTNKLDTNIVNKYRV